MENHPSQQTASVCPVQTAPSLQKGVVIQPLFNSTTQGGVKCGRVCTCLCVVFNILENSQTAERGEIRVIASNWKWRNSPFHTKGYCCNPRAIRERVHCFPEGVAVEREGGAVDSDKKIPE